MKTTGSQMADRVGADESGMRERRCFHPAGKGHKHRVMEGWDGSSFHRLSTLVKQGRAARMGRNVSGSASEWLRSDCCPTAGADACFVSVFVINVQSRELRC